MYGHVTSQYGSLTASRSGITGTATGKYGSASFVYGSGDLNAAANLLFDNGGYFRSNYTPDGFDVNAYLPFGNLGYVRGSYTPDGFDANAYLPFDNGGYFRGSYTPNGFDANAYLPLGNGSYVGGSYTPDSWTAFMYNRFNSVSVSRMLSGYQLQAMHASEFMRASAAWNSDHSYDISTLFSPDGSKTLAFRRHLQVLRFCVIMCGWINIAQVLTADLT